MVLARLIETLTWHLPVPAGWLRGGFNKGIMAANSTSVWDDAAPPVLVLKPDNLIPPCMFLVLFKGLPQCWSSD